MYTASASTSRLSNEPFNAFTAGTPVNQGWISASWTLFPPDHEGPGGYSWRSGSGVYVYDYQRLSYQLEYIQLPIITILTVQGPDSLVTAYRPVIGEWLEMLVQPPIVLWKYQIQQASPLTARGPAVAVVMASTDRENWMELDVVGYRTWTENETRTYVVQQEKSAWRPFSYFRLTISSTDYSSDAETQVGRWTLFPADIQMCEIGTFQPSLSIIAPACTPCPTGQYQAEQGQPKCLLCPTGQYQAVQGQVNCSLCPTGQYQAEQGQPNCLLCPTGQYQAVQGQTNCSLCPTGQYQAEQGQPKCLHCPTGQYQAVQGQPKCLLCPTGQYQAVQGQTNCSLCPTDQYQAVQGQTNCSLCPTGQYQAEQGKSACHTCPTDSFMRYGGATACIECAKEPTRRGVFMSSPCSPTHNTLEQECQACNLTATPCTNTTDTVCGETCTKLPPWQPEYTEWASEDYRCKQGQYLRGFRTKDDKDCVQCPPGLVGRNRLYCERCGPLEEPYFLDQSSCVCAPPARMNATGGCACPDGRYESHGACEPCGNNTFGEGGLCYPCAPGNYSSGDGATECRACPEGKYRASGQAECAGCSLGEGWYSTDSGAEACVQCNTSCAKEGLRESRRCPGDTSGRYAICTTCPQPLPANASWTSPYGNCMYECNQGFYSLTGRGGCAPCSTAPCPPGFAWSACATNADRGCDEPCTNASKPFFHSKWVPSRERACPWECEEGYSEVRSDYVMFQLVECAMTK